MISSRTAGGRYGNQFIRNMAVHFIAEKQNIIPFYTKTYEELGIHMFTKYIDDEEKKNRELFFAEDNIYNNFGFIKYNDQGTPLYVYCSHENCNLFSRKINIEGNYIYSIKDIEPLYPDKVIYLEETDIMPYILENKNLTTEKLSTAKIFCQSPEFSKYLFEYVNQDFVKKSIMDNKFKDRYKNNNDVFLHIRLGDVICYNPNFDFYDGIISTLTYDNIFIASDSPNNEICTKLCSKYNAKMYNENETDTILFGSTCKNIILSGGTFSYMIGLFGFYSNIYYPTNKYKWHGDIFNLPNWKEITF